MRIALADGLTLRVEERGAGGVPVLLLHGFTGSADAWGDGILDRLARHRRVLAPDLPGHGGSPVPESPGRLALPSVVDDLCGLLDRCGVEAAVWIGYSMGGRVALGAAVLRPERVHRLVLESASPGLETERERRARRALDEARARELEVHGLERFVDAWMELPLFDSQRRLPESVRAGERARRLTGSPEGLARALRELGSGSQPSFWDALGRISMPVLVLTGTQDTKFQAVGDRMEAGLPNASRVAFPGVGHAIHLEAPEAWCDAVEAFLTDGPER